MADPLSELTKLRIDRTTEEPARSWGRLIATVLSVALIGAGAFYALRASHGILLKPEVEVTEVALVSPAQATADLTSTGYVVPQRVAKVGAKITGRITKTHVREGQSVKAGDVLFDLDPTDQRGAVASAQAKVLAAQARAQTARANLADVNQQFDRQKKLVASGAAPPVTADELGSKAVALEASVKAADAETAASQAEVSALSATLDSFKIISPIDGTAVSKPSEVGTVVGPAVELVELVDFSSLLIETDVPEARLGVVKDKNPCEVVFDAYPDKRYAGEVVEIGPRMNRAKATGLVKVKLLDEVSGVRPDMSARVSFLAKPLDAASLAEPPKVVIPQNAVADRGGAKVVFVLDGERVRAVNVSLGELLGNGYVLKDGPKPGTRVVRNPPASLADGQSIKEKSG